MFYGETLKPTHHIRTGAQKNLIRRLIAPRGLNGINVEQTTPKVVILPTPETSSLLGYVADYGKFSLTKNRALTPNNYLGRVRTNLKKNKYATPAYSEYTRQIIRTSIPTPANLNLAYNTYVLSCLNNSIPLNTVLPYGLFAKSVGGVEAYTPMGESGVKDFVIQKVQTTDWTGLSEAYTIEKYRHLVLGQSIIKVPGGVLPKEISPEV